MKIKRSPDVLRSSIADASSEIFGAIAASFPPEEREAALAKLSAEGKLSPDAEPRMREALSKLDEIAEAFRRKDDHSQRFAEALAPFAKDLFGDVPEWAGARSIIEDASSQLLWRAFVIGGDAREVATYAASLALSDYRAGVDAWFAVARSIVEKAHSGTDEESVRNGLHIAGELAGECAKRFAPIATRLRRVVLSDRRDCPRIEPAVIYSALLGEIVEASASREMSKLGRAEVSRRFGHGSPDDPRIEDADPKHVAALRAAGLFDEPGPGLENGAFILDAILFDALRGFAEKGDVDELERKARARVESDPYKLWEPLLDDPSRWAVIFADCVWHGVVAKRIEKERRTPAALARAVSVDVLDLCTKRYTPATQDGQQALIFPDNRGWVLVPSVLDDAVNGTILQRGVDLLTTEIGIDLLEWEVTKAHSQFLSGAHDFRRIVIEGGWSALAHEHLGRSSKSDAERVRAIVLAQAHLRFESNGMRGNLLSYAEPQRHAPGRRSVVTVTLGDMLLYSYAHELKERHGNASLSAREGRRLVPILGKTALVGRAKDHASQRRMVWRLAIMLRDRAEELARDGAVHIPLGQWRDLASEAGMPQSAALLTRVIDAWQNGGDNAEPLLERTDRDYFTLHKSRKDALDFIVTGGERTVRSRADGKTSARRRANGWRKKKA